MLGMNNERMAAYNKRLMLFNLFRLKEARLSELAQMMELSVTAASHIARELETEHKVEIVPDSDSATALLSKRRRGRQAGIVRFCHSDGKVICIDLRPSSLHSVLCDLFGHVLMQERITPVSMRSQETLLDDLEREIKFYQEAINGSAGGSSNTSSTGSTEGFSAGASASASASISTSDSAAPLSVALAMHGQVDSEKGVSLLMPQVSWHEPFYVKFLLEKRVGLEVAIDNDCVMRTLAQKWFLLRQKARIDGQYYLQNGQLQDFCVINLDYGIGSSFIINQEIYRGSLFGSGQIGHTIIDPRGRLCSCGRHGCLETVATTRAIMQAVEQALRAVGRCPAHLSFEDVVKLYRQGDELVRAQVNFSASCIGLSIYNLVNVLNINHIYLYGASCAFGDEFLEAISRPVLVNPFDSQQQVKDLATFIEYGTLSPSEQIAGISYLFGERLAL